MKLDVNLATDPQFACDALWAHGIISTLSTYHWGNFSLPRTLNKPKTSYAQGPLGPFITATLLPYVWHLQEESLYLLNFLYLKLLKNTILNLRLTTYIQVPSFIWAIAQNAKY